MSKPLRPQAFTPAAPLVLAVLAGLALPIALPAQTILNTERFQIGEVDGFHMSANLNGDVQRGNSEVLTVGSSGIFGVLRGSHWTRVIFGGKYVSTPERAILDNQFVQLRYSYIFSPTLRTFHFVQAQRNETLRLRSRWLVGSGIQRELLSSERSSFSVGTGLMGEWEALSRGVVEPGDSPDSSTLRMANLAVFSRDLPSGARILNILYFQPDVSAFSDLRVLNDLGLLLPVSDRLRVTLSGEWRRDTRPPAALKKDDLSFNVGIGLDIR